jgi:hypothetical protein
MKDALGKAQTAASNARERLDFAHQGELESLEETVKSLRTRVAALEERVFGASGGPDQGSRHSRRDPDGGPSAT